MHYEVYARWFTGVFLIVFAIAMFVLRHRTIGATPWGLDTEANARIRAVFERRAASERNLPTAIGSWSLFSILLGVLTLLSVVAPFVAYALMCFSGALATGYVYLRLKNRGERRAAILQPRRPSSSVPTALYVLGAVTSLVPLTFFTESSTRWSAALVSVSALVTVAIALRVSGMAAILSGTDPEAEVYVESRLRKTRVWSLLSLAFSQSYFFMSLATPMVPRASYRSLAEAVAAILFSVCFFWMLYSTLSARKAGFPSVDAPIHHTV